MLEEVVRVIASFSRVFFFPHTKKKTLKSEHETKEIGVTIKTIVFRLNDNEGRVLPSLESFVNQSDSGEKFTMSHENASAFSPFCSACLVSINP
jgi:hypothetical protein